ncbi:MAG TPA: nuclear transport factor 2 family protein [Phnomibacter sp.]|nr:nuclear transport factor 2 family protein [Phnomibacter sp.]
MKQRMRIHPILIFVFFITQLTTASAQTRQKWMAEIVAAEKAFCEDLKSKGVAYAFAKYAAEDAVIKRENDSLIYGKAAIGKYYSSPAYKNAIADWKPDYTDVSADGTLAYTYGKYTWTFKDEEGRENRFSGVFHTVWKRQPDGTWKYVWD